MRVGKEVNRLVGGVGLRPGHGGSSALRACPHSLALSAFWQASGLLPLQFFAQVLSPTSDACFPCYGKVEVAGSQGRLASLWSDDSEGNLYLY